LADGASAGEAGRLAAGEVEPIEDLHGSAEYRRHVVAVLVERVVRRAWSRST
jgi:CO/xanthine dehydrogenase FAD-binding subunit